MKSRRIQGLILAAALAAAAAPFAATAAPSPVPSDAATTDATRNAGTIDGIVISVDYTPGKSRMVVRSGATTYDFAVLAGTNVQGPSHDFTVDVKRGSHVSVSASRSGSAYTAQTIRVLGADHTSH